MVTHTDRLVSEIRALPDEEKIRLLDALLTDLGQTNPEIDVVWANEARRRWEAYKAGRTSTVPYEELMSKYSSK
jgi:putative addiction module component (TIGR02574 family)